VLRISFDVICDNRASQSNVWHDIVDVHLFLIFLVILKLDAVKDLKFDIACATTCFANF